MKFELKPFNRNVPDIELIEDLRKVAQKLGSNQISSRQYDQFGGKFTSGTIGVRFGSWNKALERAGLKKVLKHNPTEKELFANLEVVWLSLGRQPVTRDMRRPLSEYSSSAYFGKFGSFRSALEKFVEYIGSTSSEQESVEPNVEEEQEQRLEIVFKHKTKRLPSDRLKVKVLMRDGNKCRLCGVEVVGSKIHFDHIIPWSKGGETTLDNLQVLCEAHNLAKGNVGYDDL